MGQGAPTTEFLQKFNDLRVCLPFEMALKLLFGEAYGQQLGLNENVAFL